MAYDEGLATRIREQLEGLQGLSEKKMFGGLAVLLHGNMACGILGEKLIVRVGGEQYDTALQQPHTSVLDITGKSMRGWITVEPEGFAEDEELRGWIKLGVDYANSLPPK